MFSAPFASFFAADFFAAAFLVADFVAAGFAFADSVFFVADFFADGAAVAVREVLFALAVLFVLAALFWRRDGFFAFFAGAFVAPAAADIVEFGVSELPDVLSFVRLVACVWLMCTSIASPSNRPLAFRLYSPPAQYLGTKVRVTRRLQTTNPQP